MSLTRQSLGEIAEQAGGVVQTGPFGSQLHSSDYRDDGTPVVMPQDIVDDRISVASIARVDEATTNRLARHRLAPGDLVIPRRGDLGKRALVTQEHAGWLCGTGSLKVSIAGGPVLSDYLFYYLKQNHVTQQIEGKAVGSTMLNLSATALASLEIAYPPLPTQRRIAAILAAYDDLIENNRRRMALLEEAMHLLYREWFVHLRFPGYERTQIVDGVPEGWSKSTVNDSFDIAGGSTPSRTVSAYWDSGAIQWYTPSDLTKTESMFMESSSEQITEAGLAESSARLFAPYSVMMTSRATIGAIAINTTEATTNQGFITCFPNQRIPLYFLYCWLTASTDIFNSLATGATFKEISKSVFRKIPIVVPGGTVLSEFEEIVRPVAEQMLNLQRQNRRLREARDLLLPRLMNGSIVV